MEIQVCHGTYHNRYFHQICIDWTVGYTMKSEQVESAWAYVIATYLQPAGLLTDQVDVEVRNDNGKQFSSKLMTKFSIKTKSTSCSPIPIHLKKMVM